MESEKKMEELFESEEEDGLKKDEYEVKINEDNLDNEKRDERKKKMEEFEIRM